MYEAKDKASAILSQYLKDRTRNAWKTELWQID